MIAKSNTRVCQEMSDDGFDAVMGGEWVGRGERFMGVGFSPLETRRERASTQPTRSRSHYEILSRLTSEPVLEQAYAWLCQQRHHYHHNNDVWQVRRWWEQEVKPGLVAQLRAGTYRFRAQRAVRCAGEVKEIWAALDALVLKALAIVLGEVFAPHLSPQCFHLAGTGGMKGAVRAVAAEVGAHPWVFRTDVKGYYASIDQGILYGQVARYVRDPIVLDLVGQYLRRSVSDGGEFVDIRRGISLGCPLSPLMGALYLKPLDDRMAAMGCVYVRFMDDWVVLAKTRWALRRAIRAVNEEMARLRVVQHPDKTFIGRVSRGFEFLGYWFSPQGLGVGLKAVIRMAEKVRRLYEQGASEEDVLSYLRRWGSWLKGGLGAHALRFDFLIQGAIFRALGWGLDWGFWVGLMVRW